MPTRAAYLDNVYRDLKSASERQHGRGMLGLDDRKISDALAADLISSGVSRSAVRINQAATDSAGYRLKARQWDLVIIDKGIPAAVIDWNVLRHRSNFSHQLDEIIAAAANLRISFNKTGASDFQPLLAILYVVDLAQLRSDARHSLGIFIDRLRKMLRDQILDYACVLHFDPERQALVDFSDDLAFDQFATMIASGVRSTATKRLPEADSAISLGRLLSAGDVTGVVTGLTSTSAGLSAVEAAIIASRRRKIADLQALATSTGTNETAMHRAIADNYWIFGGQYVGIAPRRDFALLDQHDYPLLCADGSIHIVELKGPECRLARRHRNHYIVTNEVHEATSQCLNYLRSLDEQGPTLEATYRNEIGIDIDFRRARGTVVIGRLSHDEASAAQTFQIIQTIRSYNAHLSRIQVVTYSDLLDAADRALRFEDLTEESPSLKENQTSPAWIEQQQE